MLLRIRLTFTLLGIILLSSAPPAFAGGGWMEESSASRTDSMNAADDGQWNIEWNLSPGHPCYQWGGVWRGWCMRRELLRESGRKRTSQLLRTGMSGAFEQQCLALSDFVERRACYRERRLQLWQGFSGGGGVSRRLSR